MGNYFDTNNSDHTDRLHPQVRGDSELGQVAGRAERDVLSKLTDARRVKDRNSADAVLGDNEGFFTTHTTAGVYAIGYPRDDTADTAPTGDELEALLDVIADVISHRLLYQNDDYEAESESRGSRSVSRSAGFDPKWPNDWMEPLDPFIEDAYMT